MTFVPWQPSILELIREGRKFANLFRDSVSMLERGCVVYRDLWPESSPGVAAHSGIYIGGGQVVSLGRNGEIRSEGVDVFRRAEGVACDVYVSCIDSASVGDEEVADTAKEMVGTARSYNLLLDNCHQFTSGCLTGDFENSDNFLTFVKATTSRTLGANTWRVWSR